MNESGTVTHALVLLAILAGCRGAAGTDPNSPPPPCGGVCGGTGPVSLGVTNATAYPIRVWWWWRDAHGDSGVVAAQASGCFHFTAATWAQLQGYYGTAQEGGDYMTDAFDPVAAPHWQLDAHPEPVPTTPPFYYGFTVSQPAVGC